MRAKLCLLSNFIVKSFPEETVSALMLFFFFPFPKFFSFLNNFYIPCPVPVVFYRREIILRTGLWVEELQTGVSVAETLQQFPVRSCLPFQYTCALESDTAHAASSPVSCSQETIPSLGCPVRLEILKTDSNESHEGRGMKMKIQLVHSTLESYYLANHRLHVMFY